jgi:hypothetical protein
MPVLRPFIIPTAGQPQPVIAPTRPRRNMLQDAFYTDQSQSQQQQYQQPDQSYSSSQSQQQPPQFEPANMTAPYIQEQMQNYANRNAPPVLQPGERVRSPNAELVQPSNFKVFYEQLAAIDRSSKEQLNAEGARAAFRRLQQLQSIRDSEVPMFNGMPVGYGNPNSPYYNNGAAGAAGSGVFGNTSSTGDRGRVQQIMQNMAKEWGWSGPQWDALVKLIMKESGFNPNAANPSSSARGLFQKMTSIHGPLENTIEGQILWGFNYIRQRYGNPINALNFHLSHNWY